MKEEIDMSYAAGILDGDGSFSIMKSNGKYYPCIQLSNAYKGMSEWLYNKFGGSLRVKKPQKEHYKPLYVWSIRGIKGCKDAIEKFFPYLVLKKPQAELMKNFSEKRLMEDFQEIDGERFALEMRNLNQDILIRHDTLSKYEQLENDCPTFWSYAAGIMDTEGSFSIKKEKPHSGSVSPRFNPMIQLTMVPSDVLVYFRRHTLLGSFCIPKSPCAQRGYVYKLSICSKKGCIEFLSKIINYLKCKKEQANVLIDFCENFKSVKYCQGKIPDHILAFREEMYQEIKMLNNTPS